MFENKRELHQSIEPPGNSKEAELKALIEILERTLLPYPAKDILPWQMTSKPLAEGLASLGAMAFWGFVGAWFAEKPIAKPLKMLTLVSFGIGCLVRPSSEGHDYSFKMNSKWVGYLTFDDTRRRLTTILESEVASPRDLTIGQALGFLHNMLIKHRKHLADVKSLFEKNNIFFSNPIYKAPEEIVHLTLGYYDALPEEKSAVAPFTTSLHAPMLQQAQQDQQLAEMPPQQKKEVQTLQLGDLKRQDPGIDTVKKILTQKASEFKIEAGITELGLIENVEQAHAWFGNIKYWNKYKQDKLRYQIFDELDGLEECDIRSEKSQNLSACLMFLSDMDSVVHDCPFPFRKETKEKASSSPSIKIDPEKIQILSLEEEKSQLNALGKSSQHGAFLVEHPYPEKEPNTIRLVMYDPTLEKRMQRRQYNLTFMNPGSWLVWTPESPPYCHPEKRMRKDMGMSDQQIKLDTTARNTLSACLDEWLPKLAKKCKFTQTPALCSQQNQNTDMAPASFLSMERI